jgi:ATP-dependent Lon protease
MTSSPAESENVLFDAPALVAADAVVFPEMEVIMTMGDPKNLAAAGQAFKEHDLVVLVPGTGPEGVVGAIGTLAHLRKDVPAEGSGGQTVARGLWRVRVQQVIDEKLYFRVRFGRAGEDEVPSGRSEVMNKVFAQVDEFVRLMPGIPAEIIEFLKSVETPGRLADMCAYSPFFTLSEKLELLRTLDPEERLAKVSRLLTRQLEDLKKVATVTTIEDCPTCMDLADRAFDLGLNQSGEVAKEFLQHVVREHPDELLVLLAARYGPAFLRRRALK